MGGFRLSPARSCKLFLMAVIYKGRQQTGTTLRGSSYLILRGVAGGRVIAVGLEPKREFRGKDKRIRPVFNFAGLNFRKNMEKAIKKAIEGGYERYSISFKIEWFSENIEEKYRILLDPFFWQALGKAMGWSKNCRSYSKALGRGNGQPIFQGRVYEIGSWRYHWHNFIDHLAEGKDAESFFAELIK